MPNHVVTRLGFVCALATAHIIYAQGADANRPVAATKAPRGKPWASKLPPPYWQNQHGVGITNGNGSGSFSRIEAQQRGNFTRKAVRRHTKPAGGGAWRLEGTTMTLAIGNGTKIVRTDDPLLASSITWPDGTVRSDFENEGFTYYRIPVATQLRSDLSNLTEVAAGLAKVTTNKKFVSDTLAGRPVYVSVGRPGVTNRIELTPGMTTRQVKTAILEAQRGELGRVGKFINQLGVALGLY